MRPIWLSVTGSPPCIYLDKVNHLIISLKGYIYNLCHKKLFLVGFLSKDDRNLCGQKELDAEIDLNH